MTTGVTAVLDRKGRDALDMSPPPVLRGRHFPDSGYGESRRGAILVAAVREAAARKGEADQKETER
ncbi:hypothetical protein [Streptomyces sp. NPDC046925]|uniref:hypothetical protein n=1 Tax=Streptomyces sp. NPDC046925 TaxID=3155375 RepID=UPI00340FAB99